MCAIIKRILVAIVLSLLVVVGLAVPAVQPVLGTTGTSVYLDPASQLLDSGAQTTVSIKISDVSNLYAGEFHLTFDPALVQVVDSDAGTEGVQIAPGSFLNPSTPMPSNLNQVDNAAGTILYAVTLTSPDVPVSGSGTIATITFQCTGESGLVDIAWENPDPEEDPVKLANSQVAAITTSWTGAQIAQNMIAVEFGSLILGNGQTGQIPITVKNFPDADGLGAYQLTLSWDATVFTITSAVAGTDFTGTPLWNSTTKLLGAYLISPPGPSGSSIEIARLNVTGVGAPRDTSTITATIDTLTDINDGTDYAGQAAASPGTVTIVGAYFEATPTSGAAPLQVQFTDMSTGTITDWSWSFGDGGTSTEQNPSHTYTQGGTYDVTLSITWSGGTTDTYTRTGYINVISAAFSGSPTAGQPPLDVQFTDESTGNITSWSWNFGDGGTSTEQNPSHTYSVEGSYTVALTVTGTAGSDTETKTNYISAYSYVALTSLALYKDTTGVILVDVKLDGLENPVTHDPVAMTDGLGAFQATAGGSPTGYFEIKGGRGAGNVFDGGLNVNTTTGEFGSFQIGSTPQPPMTLCRLAVILNGATTSQGTLSVDFSVISDTTGANIPQSGTASLNFRRGDAKADGAVNMTDAMFAAQFAVGLRGLDTCNALNAASAKHDSTSGDKVDMTDAMFIAQRAVGLRDANFNLIT